MSDFLNRNKKKGLLALLLLLLRRGKGMGPLLLMFLLLGSLFILPSGMIAGNPFLARIARVLGLRGERGAEGGLEAGMAGLYASGRRLSAVGGAGRAGGGAVQYYGKSPLDLVKGGKDLADAWEKGADRGAGRGEGRGRGLKDGGALGGILNPDDSRRGERGVAVDEDELRNGLLRNAFSGVPGAEGLGSGNPLTGSASGGGAGLLAFAPQGGSEGAAGSGSLRGARAIDKGRAIDGRGEIVKTALGGAPVPVVGGSGPHGAAKGKLGWGKNRGLSVSMAAVEGGPMGASSVMYQLAQTQAYSTNAAPPPGSCPEGTCPGEYASNASGVTFDGGQPSGSIMQFAQLGEGSIPAIPSLDEVQADIDKAKAVEKNAQECRRVEEANRPQQEAGMDKLDELADQMTAMDCGKKAGCSASKAKKCQRIGDQMKVECGKVNAYSRAIADACASMATEKQFEGYSDFNMRCGSDDVEEDRKKGDEMRETENRLRREETR